MVKKNSITYERLDDLEDDNIASIWLKIKTERGRYLYLMGGYRQWRLPNQAGYPESYKTENQVIRFKKIIDQIKKARLKSDQVLVAFDSNIDQSIDKDSTKRQDLKELIPLYEDFRNEDDFVIINSDMTRFQSGCEPSHSDHFLTSSPQYIDNVETKPGAISDHFMVKCLYHTKELTYFPQFRYSTDWTKLSPESVNRMIVDNPRINEVMKLENHEKIWAIIVGNQQYCQ